MVNCLVLWSVDNTLLVCLAGVLAKHIPSITPRWELVGHALDVGQTVLTPLGALSVIRIQSASVCWRCGWKQGRRSRGRSYYIDVLQDQQLNETVQKIRQSLRGVEDVAS